MKNSSIAICAIALGSTVNASVVVVNTGRVHHYPTYNDPFLWSQCNYGYDAWGYQYGRGVSYMFNGIACGGSVYVGPYLSASEEELPIESEVAPLESCLEHAGTAVEEAETLFAGLELGTYYGYEAGITMLAHLMRDLPNELAGCEDVQVDEEAWNAVFGDASAIVTRVASEAGFEMSKTDPAFRAALAAAKKGHWEVAGAKIAAYLAHAGENLE